MSSRRRSSWLRGLIGFAAILSTASVVFGQEHAARSDDRRCADFYLARVAYLLGCCGDLEVAYPGGRFASPLDAVQRATRALAEIDLATMSPCAHDRVEDRIDLKLNRIGAYIMCSRARVEGPDELAGGLRDANVAAGELRAFVQSHPRAAAKLWLWLAMAFRRSGRPLDALAFLAGVEKSCCQRDYRAAAQLAAIKGDILFELAVYGPAGNAYSQWLGSVNQPSLCGRERSLSNIRELRRRGFQIPTVPGEQESRGPCLAGSEWEPYAGVPR
jgi:hypothetical protein